MFSEKAQEFRGTYSRHPILLIVGIWLFVIDLNENKQISTHANIYTVRQCAESNISCLGGN